MSRDPGYSRPNGAYTNGNGGYNSNGGYGSYGASNDDYAGRPSGESRRRPGGYGGLGGEANDESRSPSRPSNDRPRRPGGYGAIAPSEDNYAPRPSTDSARERRPGGYGGFQPRNPDRNRDRSQEAPPVARPTSIERMPERPRSGGRYGNTADRSRSRPGGQQNYGPGSQRIEEVIKYIQNNWDFMTGDQCVPIEVALKLMDSSSLGLADQHDQFRQSHQELQQALKAIVNEHHQGFNSSIGTFHQIQTSLQSSQSRVRNLKTSLTSAKTQLSTAKPELREFATSSQNYDEMLQMLNTIEQLQLVPEKLEARISEKRFLTAVDILQDALRMIRKSEMENIGALSDLRTYLSNQEVSLTDILIEELHGHLYLKSPYCEDRWKEYAQNQSRGDVSERAQADVRGRLLYYFLEGLDAAEPVCNITPLRQQSNHHRWRMTPHTTRRQTLSSTSG